MQVLPGKIKSLLLITVLSLGITGCANFSAVKESDRAVSGKYDGTWAVEVKKAAELQYVQGWNFSCGDMSNKFSVLVSDGMLQIGRNGKNYKTAVAENGRFKMVIPIEGRATESIRSGKSIDNGDMQIILRGSLADGKEKGHITHGIAEVGYGGCTAKTKFKRTTPRKTI